MTEFQSPARVEIIRRMLHTDSYETEPTSYPGCHGCFRGSQSAIKQRQTPNCIPSTCSQILYMAPHMSLQLHLEEACPYCCRGISILDILWHVMVIQQGHKRAQHCHLLLALWNTLTIQVWISKCQWQNVHLFWYGPCLIKNVIWQGVKIFSQQTIRS
jgi:hypothetical protein